MTSQAGKGDNDTRIKNRKQYRENFDRIFSKKTVDVEPISKSKTMVFDFYSKPNSEFGCSDHCDSPSDSCFPSACESEIISK